MLIVSKIWLKLPLITLINVDNVNNNIENLKYNMYVLYKLELIKHLNKFKSKIFSSYSLNIAFNHYRNIAMLYIFY